MVSTASILSILLTLFLSLVLPVVFLIFLVRGRKGVFGIWIAGALGFLVPQLGLRLPALQFLNTLAPFQEFGRIRPVLLVLALALTAALMETTGRWLILRYALSKRLSYTTGIVAGAGHGGIESISIVGLLYINNLVFSLALNTGTLTAFLPGQPELAESIRQSLLSVSPSLFLMAGFERVFTMIFHIALSVLFTLFIMQRRTGLGFLLVASLHFATDFIAGLMQTSGLPAPAIEGFLLLVAAGAAFLIWRIRPRFGDRRTIPADPGEQAVEEGY